MTVKIIDSYQNTVCNLDSDECTESTGRSDNSQMGGASHGAISVDPSSARPMPYIHDAATDWGRRSRMH